MKNFKQKCIDTLSKVRPCSTFLSIKNYKNNFGEVSDYSICFKISYKNAIKRSLKKLKEKDLSKIDISDQKFSISSLEEALEELIASYENTLEECNPGYIPLDIYDLIKDPDGKIISGIKIHKDRDIIYLQGLFLKKRIIKKGSYPNRNLSEKTLAKNFLKRDLPIGRFVNFKLTPERFRKIHVDKNIINGEL